MLEDQIQVGGEYAASLFADYMDYPGLAYRIKVAGQPVCLGNAVLVPIYIMRGGMWDTGVGQYRPAWQIREPWADYQAHLAAEGATDV